MTGQRFTVVAPFSYEVLNGGCYMPAIIDGTWIVIAVRGDSVQLQKETEHDQCSYDGIYLSVWRYVLASAFRPAEANAIPVQRGLVVGREGVHSGLAGLGTVSNEGGSDRGSAKLQAQRRVGGE